MGDHITTKGLDYLDECITQEERQFTPCSIQNVQWHYFRHCDLLILTYEVELGDMICTRTAGYCDGRALYGAIVNQEYKEAT